MTDDPKIIIDDDWKSQIEQEKEQLAKEEADQRDQEPQQATEFPPASFEILVGTLSTQALAALGFLNDPLTGQPNVNHPMAKHFIDTLGVLEEKTKGNLTSQESQLLTETLHQLRMAFVSVPDNNEVADDPGQKSSKIELP